MPLLTPEEMNASLASRGTLLSIQAQQERGVITPGPTNQFSFSEQVRSGFNTENVFVNNILPMMKSRPVFESEPGFDPTPHLGPYEQFTEQFPELLESESQSELIHIKTRIDKELHDRTVLEDMGFVRSLAVLLPANFLSPENFIPIGAAVRGAYGIGKVGAKGLLRAGAATGTESAIAAAVAEAALQQKQGFRTTEESVLNVVGAGLFGSVLGSSGAAMGATRRKALKALIGHESVAEAFEALEDAFVKATNEGEPLRLKLEALTDKHLFQEERQSSDLFDAKNEGLTQDIEDPARGLIADFMKEHNPKLAALLGLEGKVGRFIAKSLVLTPAARLAGSDVQESRVLGGVITKHFMTREGAQGPSVESMLELGRIALTRMQDDMRQTYSESRQVFRKLDVAEEEVFDMVGLAARRLDDAQSTVPTRKGGVPSDPFAKVRGNPEALEVLTKLAQQNRNFFDIVQATTDRVGAMSKNPAQTTKATDILAKLDRSFLPRFVDHDKVMNNRPGLRQNLKDAYMARRGEVLPEFEAELKTARAELEDASDATKEIWADQVDELEEWIAKLKDPDEFDNIVFSIEENYSAPPSSGPPRMQSSLEQRVNKIDETFLEEFLVHDVRALQGRVVRSVLPDLLLADQWDRKLGGSRPLQAELGKTLDRIHADVERIKNEGGDPAAAQKIARDMEDALEDSQELTLTQQLRLLRDLEAAGVDVDYRVTQDVIHKQFEVRKRERRKQFGLREERASLEVLAKAFGKGEEADALGVQIAAINDKLAVSSKTFGAVTKKLNGLARKVGDQVGESARSKALGFGTLKVTDSRLSLKGAFLETDMNMVLGSLDRMVHAKVGEARRRVFQLNVDTEHLARAIERGYLRDSKLSKNQFPGKAAMNEKRMAKDIASVETEIQRLQNRHGAGSGSDFFAKNGKRLRQLNYVTKMGSVLLSSLSDMFMAISTAGFVPYARAVRKFMSEDIFTSANRSDVQDWVRSAELYSDFGRHERIFSIDDELRDGLETRFDKGMDAVTKRFTKLTGLDKWNAVHKQIAVQAIESRMVRTIKAGDPSAKDIAMLEFFGIDLADLPKYRKLFDSHANEKRGLHFANAGDWDGPDGRRLRLNWTAAAFKGANDTVVTPSVGDLPDPATANPFGRSVFQFRNFMISSTQRHLFPDVQRLMAFRDADVAINMAFLTMTGMMVYSANEWLNGRDPFAGDKWAQTMALEGADRGGAFGIITEGSSTAMKLLGIPLPGGQGPSRFRSRNDIDALFGPSLGLARDVQQAGASLWRDDFISGDAARIRRLVPMQNLIWLRMLLDAGPSLPSAGTRRYFDDFLKIDQRIGGFEPRGAS